MIRDSFEISVFEISRVECIRFKHRLHRRGGEIPFNFCCHNYSRARRTWYPVRTITKFIPIFFRALTKCCRTVPNLHTLMSIFTSSTWNHFNLFPAAVFFIIEKYHTYCVDFDILEACLKRGLTVTTAN